MYTDYQNRIMTPVTDAPVITGAFAADISGINHGTIRKMQSRQEVAPAPLGVTDVLNLTVASRIAELGVPLVRTCDIASVVSAEDWASVMVREEET